MTVQAYLENKESLIKHFALHEGDTGSVSVQAALLTARIKYLTDHLASNKKDFAARSSLLKIISKRNKLMRYAKENDKELHSKLISSLSLKSK